MIKKDYIAEAFTFTDQPPQVVVSDQGGLTTPLHRAYSFVYENSAFNKYQGKIKSRDDYDNIMCTDAIAAESRNLLQLTLFQNVIALAISAIYDLPEHVSQSERVIIATDLNRFMYNAEQIVEIISCLYTSDNESLKLYSNNILERDKYAELISLNFGSKIYLQLLVLGYSQESATNIVNSFYSYFTPKIQMLINNMIQAYTPMIKGFTVKPITDAIIGGE